MAPAQVVVRVLELRTQGADTVDEEKGYQGVEQGGGKEGWLTVERCFGR